MKFRNAMMCGVILGALVVCVMVVRGSAGLHDRIPDSKDTAASGDTAVIALSGDTGYVGRTSVSLHEVRSLPWSDASSPGILFDEFVRRFAGTPPPLTEVLFGDTGVRPLSGVEWITRRVYIDPFGTSLSVVIPKVGNVTGEYVRDVRGIRFVYNASCGCGAKRSPPDGWEQR